MNHEILALRSRLRAASIALLAAAGCDAPGAAERPAPQPELVDAKPEAVAPAEPAPKPAEPTPQPKTPEPTPQPKTPEPAPVEPTPVEPTPQPRTPEPAPVEPASAEPTPEPPDPPELQPAADPSAALLARHGRLDAAARHACLVDAWQHVILGAAQDLRRGLT